MTFTAIAVFILCCERFKRRDQELMGRYAVLGVSLLMVGGYIGTTHPPVH